MKKISTTSRIGGRIIILGVMILLCTGIVSGGATEDALDENTGPPSPLAATQGHFDSAFGVKGIASNADDGKTPASTEMEVPQNTFRFDADPPEMPEHPEKGVPVVNDAPGPAYIIGPGDILEISVWKDESLTKMVPVLPDGRISFPLIGQIVAGGKTAEELSNELQIQIHTYVPDPILSVTVQQVNSLLIYVIGKVNRPGHFLLNRNVNVLQALSMAGGLNPFAKRNKIKIFRKTEEGTLTLGFHYDDVENGLNLEQNIILKRGDVIVVP